MKKTELKIHAENLEAAYHESQKAWAAMGLLYAALRSGDKAELPPLWMQLETIRDTATKLGEIGLNIAEFLDAYHEAKGAQHGKN